ncbi:hypothetical protein ALHIDCOG_00184 [Klebsiella phage CPRSB]|nr:hypothetical protein ALHIDCOG_00184 [Klebsiella phage CPRSB]
MLTPSGCIYRIILVFVNLHSLRFAPSVKRICLIVRISKKSMAKVELMYLDKPTGYVFPCGFADSAEQMMSIAFSPSMKPIPGLDEKVMNECNQNGKSMVYSTRRECCLSLHPRKP